MPTGSDVARGLDSASALETADYFTEPEYRAVTKDNVAGEQAQWEDIERAQVEVIELLETWARTAWRRRVFTERARVGLPKFALARVPVISVSVFNLGAVPYLASSPYTDYSYTPGGIVRWGDPNLALQPLEAIADVEITYTYGYDVVPWSVKRPCIVACRNLVRGYGENNIPEDTESYTSGGTTIRFARAGDAPELPWPWDAESSAAVRAYWGPRRPRRFLTGA